MGRLSAAMKLELKKQMPQVAFLLELGPIGETTYRYADAAYITSRIYEARVLSWGTGIACGVNTEENVLDFSSVEIELDDTDQAITQIVEGPYRNSVRGATAVIKLGSRNVTSTDWLTLYTGRIETYAQPSPLVWTFTLAPQNLPLVRESVPRATITRASWPNAPIESIDLACPIIYGEHSSASGTNTGAVPAILVDRVGYRYMLSAGALLAVDKVYADGVSVVSSAYTVTNPVVNGRTYTLIDFTADQGVKVITADVRGYYVTGDEGNVLLSSPDMITWHFLSNWVYSDYRTGSWVDYTSLPIDVAGTFAAAVTFFTGRGYEGSLYVGQRRRGIDILNELLVSYGAKAFWTLDGKIGYVVEDYTSWAYVTDGIVQQDEISNPSLSYPVSGLVDGITGRYGLAAASGLYMQELAVKDLSTGELAPGELELPASPAFIV